MVAKLLMLHIAAYGIIVYLHAYYQILATAIPSTILHYYLESNTIAFSR